MPPRSLASTTPSTTQRSIRKMDTDRYLDEKTLVLLLQQCEAEITRLQSQLQRQQELKASIEPKLAIVRSLRAPVARMPRELLSMIFFELIRDDPKAIGPTLLVCRQWNSVACNSPTLWPDAIACFTADVLDIVKQASFLKAAVRYTGNAPLHVTLNLPSLVDFWERLGARISAPPLGYRPEWMDGLHLNDRPVISWLMSAHDNVSTRLPSLKYIDSALYAEMFSIANTIGNQASHLRSLTLRFNAKEFKSWLSRGGFNLFYEQTPLLEDLSIIDNSANNRQWPTQPRNLFPNLITSLIRVSWKINWSITVLIPPFGRLTHLRLWLSDGLHNFPSNRYTNNITHLFLDLMSSHWEDRSFFLPHLEDLTLTEPLPRNLFEAPRLVTLRLLDRRVTYFALSSSPVFPSLKKLHFRPRPLPVEALIIAHVNQLPYLTEVGFIYHALEEIETPDIVKLIREHQIPVKAYRLIMEDRWSFDFNSYECNEIPVDFEPPASTTS